MGRGAATIEQPTGTVAPLRSPRSLQTGDVGETWQVVDRETGDILAECATEDLAWEFVDGQADAEVMDVTGPDPVD